MNFEGEFACNLLFQIEMVLDTHIQKNGLTRNIRWGKRLSNVLDGVKTSR